ncbi:MAG: hypothetical protein ACXVB4_16805 [Pseudobdellovibrionaceae bacterium]
MKIFFALALSTLLTTGPVMATESEAIPSQSPSEAEFNAQDLFNLQNESVDSEMDLNIGQMSEAPNAPIRNYPSPILRHQNLCRLRYQRCLRMFGSHYPPSRDRVVFCRIQYNRCLRSYYPPHRKPSNVEEPSIQE